MNIHRYWGLAYLVYFSYLNWPMKVFYLLLHLISWRKKKTNKVILLSILAGVTIYLKKYYGTLLDVEAASAFMLSLYYLKELEGQEGRDEHVLFLLAFLALGISAMFLTNALVFLLFVAHFFILLYSRLRNRKIVSFVLLSSLPMALWIFFFFPRTPFTLVNLGARPKAYVGFTKELRLDLFDSLELNNAVVMRVEGQNLPLNYYWRGEILDTHDGLNWTRSNQSMNIKGSSQKQLSSSDNIARVELAKNYENYLFTPDYTYNIFHPNPTVEYLADQFLWRGPAKYKTNHYDVYYNKNLQINGESPSINYLQKVNVSSEVSDLAKTLLPDFEKNLKNYFRANSFSYVLDPGRINSLDDFLFKTKKGYCSHFASAVGILAREAGIPSRLVMGFLGGEFNSIGDYLTIRESDAHAWVELFLDGKWKRVDPTLYVASGRAEGSGDNFYNGKSNKLVQTANEIVEYMNRQWLYFTQEYDSEAQEKITRKSFFDKFDFWTVGTILFSLFVLGIALIVLILGRRKVKVDEIDLYTMKFLEKIKYTQTPFPLEVERTLQDEEKRLWQQLTLYRFSTPPTPEEWGDWKWDFQKSVGIK